MSYGLGDANDARKAEALEAQASDLEKTAASLESTQPSASFGLKAQAAAMRQQADAFRKVSGLPDAGSWSLGAKIGLSIAVGAAVVWLWKNKN